MKKAICFILVTVIMTLSVCVTVQAASTDICHTSSVVALRAGGGSGILLRHVFPMEYVQARQP